MERRKCVFVIPKICKVVVWKKCYIINKVIGKDILKMYQELKMRNCYIIYN